MLDSDSNTSSEVQTEQEAIIIEPKELDKKRGSKVVRFIITALGGGVPFIGGVAGAATSAWSEAEQANYNKLFETWIKLQEDEIREIGATLEEVFRRLDLSDEAVAERVESREFLSLVRKSIRNWSAAESEEKRRLVSNLLSNAGACKLCSDDVISLFIEWIAKYSEAHFMVIRTLYVHSRSTRHGIWEQIHGDSPREDSAEADLFKLLIRDLSTGAIIRQHREVDYYGNYIKKKKSKGSSSGQQMKSAFDDEDEYVLTELGKQFVHYTMNEVVPKLESSKET